MKTLHTELNTTIGSALISGLVGGALLLGAVSVSASEVESSIARGGLLYDKWYKVNGAPEPKKSHPAYPADKKYAKKPGANWRCKECHGWDYMGKDGAYSSGKHYSGIKGINGAKGAAPEKVVAILKDSTHGYTSKMLSDQDFQDLAMFVSKGQSDTDEYIDRATKKVKGNVAKGEAYYNTICAGCHGKDGMKVKDMKPMGQLANSNPWENMHKIMNGQPDEQMPALRALDEQISVDTLAYTQGLPQRK
ncbi:MAG: hypothetical protein DRQ37_03230 [Gammaproteobacteria bacterium]|nr:MAG: hypothetical protein DRQ37_03230 [Gammaproteobacteria bacterium]